MKKPLLFFIFFAVLVIGGFTFAFLDSQRATADAKKELLAFLEDKYEEPFVALNITYEESTKTYTAIVHPKKEEDLAFTVSKKADEEPIDDYIESASVYYQMKRVETTVDALFPDAAIDMSYDDYPFLKLVLTMDSPLDKQAASEAAYALLTKIGAEHASIGTVEIAYDDATLVVEQPFDVKSSEHIATLWTMN